MPRYFFHIHNDRLYQDEEGTELPSLKEVWEQAGKTCGAMLKDLDGDFVLGREWQMEVRDESGGLCWRFHFVAEGIDPNG